jgi:hypothetical protein
VWSGAGRRSVEVSLNDGHRIGAESAQLVGFWTDFPLPAGQAFLAETLLRAAV